MNDYDDLFKDFNSQPRDKAMKQPPILGADEPNEFEFQIRERKVTALIVLLYVAISFVVIAFNDIYMSLLFPDQDAIVANIVANTPTFTILDSGNAEAPYLVILNGSVTNNNARSLPELWFDIEFFAGEESLGVISLTQNEITEGYVWVIDEQYQFVTSPETFSYTYGFSAGTRFGIIINLAQVLILAIAYLFIDRRNFKKSALAFRKSPGTYLGKMAIGFGIVYAALIISGMLLTILGQDTGSQNETTIASLFSSNITDLVLLFLLLVVFTPIVEELVFRRVLFGFIERWLGPVAAILSSGIVFGLMHVIGFGDYIQAIPYVLMGIAFGFIYSNSSKNIYVAIGVHAINNFVAYAIYAVPIIFSLLLA